MNILNKIQYQMQETKSLRNILNDIIRHTEYLITFHDHRAEPSITVHRANSDEQVRCVMSGDNLVAMDGESPTKELIATLSFINERVNQL